MTALIGFDFLRPQWLGLAACGLLVLAVGLWAVARRRSELARMVAAGRLAAFLPGLSVPRSTLRVVLAALGLALLGVTATGPVRGYTFQEAARRGIDIVVCLDTSNSMLATDLRPSRLERARREVRGLLARSAGDRIGLLAFAGDSREVAPLTHDRVTLEGLLDHARPEDNRMGGTDLAATLRHALELFDGRTGAHEAIVLLTDGEDLSGAGQTVAQEARDQGIRIYVVGVGTEAGGKIPFTDAGGKQGFLRDREGQEVVTRLDGATLRALAETTGGEYLSTENSPTPLEDLYAARITRLEGRDLEDGMRRVPHDRYQWTLALALLCLLVETGLREARTRGGKR